MRIAIIGSGIAGLASAWLLSREHQVTLFEANDYLGGHTHTHGIECAGRKYAVDTGFIVFNRTHYPLLTRMFDEIGVMTQTTRMSFSAQDEARGLEYNAGTLGGLLVRPRNLVSSRFWRMLGDILRFYRHSPALLENDDAGPTLGHYLDAHGYSEMFRDDHLVPMASALWSMPPAQVLEFPVKYLVQFMSNHSMLQVRGRPTWLAVQGGSARYVDALRARWRARVRLEQRVTAVQRDSDGVNIETGAGTERFDHAVLACHADDALALLRDPDVREQEVLGAFRFQDNETLLHTDTGVLPDNRRLWAAWNAHIPADRNSPCTVTYCMNLLQSLNAPETFCVSLNCSDRVDPDKVLRRMRYRHPVYTHATVGAQKRKAEIQGQRRTWFAGAWWGFGFHEDGMRSAVEVANALQVAWP